MPAMTRKAALGDARIAYTRLVNRARQVHPDRLAYIEAIAVRWDARLVDLQRFTGSTIPGWTQRVFEHLMISADERQIDDADLLEWVDAFPDAIADIFPPSAATFQGVTAQKAAQPVARATVRSRMERPAA
jgi:hypothetical protein